jgi:hypothetical protein
MNVAASKPYLVKVAIIHSVLFAIPAGAHYITQLRLSLVIASQSYPREMAKQLAGAYVSGKDGGSRMNTD